MELDIMKKKNYCSTDLVDTRNALGYFVPRHFVSAFIVSKKTLIVILLAEKIRPVCCPGSPTGGVRSTTASNHSVRSEAAFFGIPVLLLFLLFTS